MFERNQSAYHGATYEEQSRAAVARPQRIENTNVGKPATGYKAIVSLPCNILDIKVTAYC
jgi:hypothetical protein